jgi:uncharacterized protein YneF (UPF0154 family)
MTPIDAMTILAVMISSLVIGLFGGFVIARILFSPVRHFKPALTPYDRMVADRVKSN